MPGTVLGQGVETDRPGPLLSGAYILVRKIIKNVYERQKKSQCGWSKESEQGGKVERRTRKGQRWMMWGLCRHRRESDLGWGPQQSGVVIWLVC